MLELTAALKRTARPFTSLYTEVLQQDDLFKALTKKVLMAASSFLEHARVEIIIAI